MMLFSTILEKIKNWQVGATQNLAFSGVSHDQWAFLFALALQNNTSSLSNRNHLIICSTNDEAEQLYDALSSFAEIRPRLSFFPGLDCSPYSSILPSERSLFSRFRVLNQIIFNPDPKIIIATTESSLLLNPPRSFFTNLAFKVSVEDILGPHDLISKLTQLGYNHATTVEEPGTFSRRGEILDIFPVSTSPVRIQYYDDLVENIYPIDPLTQKSDRTKPLHSIHIAPSPHVIIQTQHRTLLRDKLPMPRPGQKQIFERRKEVLQNLTDGKLFDNYPFFLPLCFETSHTIYDFFPEQELTTTLIRPHEVTKTADSLCESLEQEYLEYLQMDDPSLLAPDSKLIYSQQFFDSLAKTPVIQVDNLDLSHELNTNLTNTLNLQLISVKSFLGHHQASITDRSQYIPTLFKFIAEQFELSGTILITTSSENAKNEILFLLQKYTNGTSIASRTSFIRAKLHKGFFYPTEKILVLSDADLFAYKANKAKAINKVKADPFAEQLATLKPNDFVIHSQHGIGRYLGMESLETAGTKTDFLVVEYTDSDKIYVPVYRLDLISKHSDSQSGAHVASLRSNKFAAQINRARLAAKQLAFDLIELEAKRRSTESHRFSPPDHNYNDFELAFPFQETPDQLNAINQVIESMQKPLPMDHLVCGDVGFGKTEVAMRAAFLAVLDKKQVAILVPTTILALQHYLSFIKRFKKFPVSVDFLSRFKSPAETKIIKEKIAEGKIDIIIGTHKLIADTVKYHDLGLLIIDEEHRFGVNHKEKLKLIRAAIDCLTLSATPIPRTLQLSFMGLKELSLIQTAPPKRQSIKTYLIKHDPQTIKSALEKEITRGGQVFFVHNRVQDIEKIKAELLDLLPDAKIIVAHGQLPERELENRMRDFYYGKYQVLLATTIIESGIDIPNANTLIVNRADCFGLAQLHQLRGRIGRSDKKAYAYFIIPKNRSLTPIAETRLKTLQTYADIGSGFSIASSDLEIRGAGNILGAQQSGHIEAIGLELYMDLVKEAIASLKNTPLSQQKNVVINVPFPCYIPSSYIQSDSERLRQYKKLSNCSSVEHLEQYRSDLNDIYGFFPQEVESLFTILTIRCLLHNKGIENLNLAGKTILIRFDRTFFQEYPTTRDIILDYFLSRPRKFKLSPDFSVTYSSPHEMSLDELLIFSKDIAEKIVLC